MNCKGLFVMIAASMSLTVVANPDTIRAKWFETTITPEIGSLIAGYGTNDVSVAKYDELLATGLCLDDRTNRIVIISLDLMGLDIASIKEVRRRVSAAVGTSPECVLVSCTHTHEGPYTGMYRKEYGLAERTFDETPGSADMRYEAYLFGRIEEAARKMAAEPWGEFVIGFHSARVDENRNRRYTTEENRASFNAHRPILHKLTTGIADKELGTVALMKDGGRIPAYVIGNYAAHALAAHVPGLGGHRISSDFPGFYRRYIESESGAKAMFVQGAAGDLVPKDDELGTAAARRVGENLAMASVLSVISLQRCFERFAIARPRVGAVIRTFSSRLREEWRRKLGKDTEEFEIQCVAVGDVCFVGVPGEIVNEIGLEIKWNSPFARTFVAFLGTGYSGYITPMNLMAAGGYEPQSHRFSSRDTLTLVRTAQDAMLELRARLYPQENEGADPYPDNLHSPVVNMPGMYKGTKWGH